MVFRHCERYGFQSVTGRATVDARTRYVGDARVRLRDAGCIRTMLHVKSLDRFGWLRIKALGSGDARPRAKLGSSALGSAFSSHSRHWRSFASGADATGQAHGYRSTGMVSEAHEENLLTPAIRSKSLRATSHLPFWSAWPLKGLQRSTHAALR